MSHGVFYSHHFCSKNNVPNQAIHLKCNFKEKIDLPIKAEEYEVVCLSIAYRLTTILKRILNTLLYKKTVDLKLTQI